MIKFTFLGTGNAFSQDARLPSCYLLETKNNKILLDCGPSILIALNEVKVSTKEIDTVILSHLHADHSAGLPYLMLEDKWISKRKVPLKIYAPKGSKDHFRKLSNILYGKKDAEHLEEAFEFIDFDVTQKVEFSDIKLEALEAIHTNSAKMIYLETNNFSLGYSGDSAFHRESFKKLLKADLVIHESLTYDINVPNHVNYLELSEEIKSINIPSDKKIYLTHVSTNLIENKDKIKPPFFLAYDNLKLIFENN